MHFADAICANAICAIAKLKTIKNLFNNNLILLYIIIYNNINIIIYLNEYIFDFQIAQLHNCTIAQLLKHTGSGVLCGSAVRFSGTVPTANTVGTKKAPLARGAYLLNLIYEIPLSRVSASTRWAKCHTGQTMKTLISYAS